MAGAACAEWHLHAWDLARAQGKDYRPANPEILLRGWLSGMPQLPAGAAGQAQAGRGTGEAAVVRELGVTAVAGAGPPGPVARPAPGIRQDFAGQDSPWPGAVAPGVRAGCPLTMGTRRARAEAGA